MKKILNILFVLALTVGLMSWHWVKNKKSAIDKTETISCFNMETVTAYQIEASQKTFANMHPTPKDFHTENLLGKMIKFTTNDGIDAQAYFIPAKKKTTKWLVVIQEWWGLNENIKMESDKYYNALSDFNIIALDMYDGKIANTPDSAMKLMQGANMQRMVGIIEGAIKYAGNKVSIYSLGWCFGGMWSLQTAILAGNQAKGCVMYYGRPENNIDKLKTIKCDVIGFFGNKDKSPSPEMVNEFESNLKSLGKNISRYNYNAGHGFANPSNPSFVESARDDAFIKSIDFLKTH